MQLREWRHALFKLPTRPADDDESALLAAAKHDIQQFATVYERYFPRIYRYCLRRCSTPDEAEDLTSQVFTKAIAGIQGYRGGSVAAWLFQIAHHTTLNYLQRHHRALVSIEAHDLDFMAENPHPLDNILQDEAHQIIRELIGTLSDEEKNLLALKVTAELTAAEIGQLLGKSAGAIRVEIHRLIQRLRHRYEARMTIKLGENA